MRFESVFPRLVVGMVVDVERDSSWRADVADVVDVVS